MVVFAQCCIFFGLEMIKTHSETYFGPEYLHFGNVLDKIFITFCYDFRNLAEIVDSGAMSPCSEEISDIIFDHPAQKKLGNREISMSRFGFKKISSKMFAGDRENLKKYFF